jgi:hypothetical protein
MGQPLGLQMGRLSAVSFDGCIGPQPVPGIWLKSFEHFILDFFKCHEREEEESFSQAQAQKGCRHQHDFPAAGEIVLFDRS